MKNFLLTILLIFTNYVFGKAQSNIKWELVQGIKNPESVLYDSIDKVLYVSSIDGAGDKKDGKGHISKVSIAGELLQEKWVSGLNAPKGMRRRGNILWVSDIDEVLKISIVDRKIIGRVKVKGAKFLNDIAIDDNGEVYVSDTLTSKIHVISDNKASVLVEGKEYGSPNGLLVVKNNLIVASWGYTTDWSTKKFGEIYSVSLDDREVKKITKKPLGNLDGLELDKSGNFLVSDWVAGKVYKVTPKGAVSLIFSYNKGLADIGVNSGAGIIYAPMMQDGKVIAVKY